MKTVIFVVLSLLLAAPAFAQTKTKSGLSVCYTGTEVPLVYNEDSRSMAQYANFLGLDNVHFVKSSIRCDKLKEFDTALQRVVLVMAVGSAGFSFTTVGVPISVTLGIGAAGFGYLSFVVGNIECDDDRETFRRKVKDAVCEVLEGQANVSCVGGNFQFIDNQPLAPMCKAEEKI